MIYTVSVAKGERVFPCEMVHVGFSCAFLFIKKNLESEAKYYGYSEVVFWFGFHLMTHI